ncbi:MAG TPA: transcriptional regulator [Myxococcales bacterium]|nr:transcriptional regulator [Myxococcales bacterium]HBU47433.1 transcriptional regulator [Myxococcales bacterium]
MVGRKVCTTIYLEAEQVAALKRLKARTRVPISAFIREGIDDVLQRYGELKEIEEVST